MSDDTIYARGQTWVPYQSFAKLRDGLVRAIDVLENPSGPRYRTARELRELLERLEPSGNPGELETPPEGV